MPKRTKKKEKEILERAAKQFAAKKGYNRTRRKGMCDWKTIQVRKKFRYYDQEDEPDTFETAIACGRKARHVREYAGHRINVCDVHAEEMDETFTWFLRDFYIERGLADEHGNFKGHTPKKTRRQQKKSQKKVRGSS